MLCIHNDQISMQQIQIFPKAQFILTKELQQAFELIRCWILLQLPSHPLGSPEETLLAEFQQFHAVPSIVFGRVQDGAMPPQRPDEATQNQSGIGRRCHVMAGIVFVKLVYTPSRRRQTQADDEPIARAGLRTVFSYKSTSLW